MTDTAASEHGDAMDDLCPMGLRGRIDAARAAVDECGADEAALEVISGAALNAYVENHGHVNCWPLSLIILHELRKEGFEVVRNVQ